MKSALNFSPARLLLILLISAVLTFIASSAAFSQDKTDKPEKIPGLIEPIPPKLPSGAIELSEIFNEAEKTKSSISEIIEKASGLKVEPVEAEVIEALISQSDKKLKKRSKQKTLSLSFLNQELGEWNSKIDGLENQSKESGVKISSAESYLAELTELKAKWQITLDAYRKVGDVNAPLSKIEEVIAALDNSLDDINKVIQSFFQIQEELDKDKTLIKKHLDLLTDKLEVLTQSIWQKNTPSVLDKAFYTSLKEFKHIPFKNIWKENLDEFKDYIDTVRTKLTLEILSVLILFFIFRIIGKQVEERSVHIPTSDDIVGFFHQSFFIAIIVTLLPGLYFHPGSPVLFNNLYFLLLAISAVAILIKLITTKTLKYFLIGMAIIYIIGSTKILILGTTSIERVFVILQSVLGIIIAVFTLRPSGPDNESPELNVKHPLTLEIAAKRAIILALSVVLILEGIGYHQAADYLNHLSFNSIYLSLFAYAVFKLLKIFSTLIIYSGPAKKLNIIDKHILIIDENVNRYFAFGTGIVWGYLLLKLWKLNHTVLSFAKTILDTGFSIGENRITIGIIGGSFLAIYLSIKLSKLIKFVLNEEIYTRIEMQSGLNNVIDQFIKYFLVLVGFIIALSIIGVKLQSLAIVAGALGIGIGFGLQTIVNNFVSGLIILLERPIKVSDVIEIDGLLGTVKHIGIRATLIETLDHAEIIVPNGDLLGGKLTNWTLTTSRNRITISAGASYNADPKKVLQILDKVAKSHSEVLDFPAPSVIFTGFGDSSIDFEIRCWVDTIYRRVVIASEIRTLIFAEFEKNGIEIPFPQRDIHIKPEQNPDTDLK